jgi:protein-S-isoprenylcysteine O-methyltransferase Ste14
MLSRLILLALQLVVAWFAAPVLVRYIPGLGRLELFVYAAVFAVLVWLVGVVGSQVLKETAMPSSAALATALVVALIAAAIYTWLPMVMPDAKRVMLNLQEKAYPLIGALIGYHIRR